MNLKPNEIKDVLSMQALLESYGIQLRQKGNSLVGCCPIHQGDNPNAFHVNLQRNLWHCFTREHGGDVFNFIMEFERVDFQGALEIAQALIKNANDRLDEERTRSNFLSFLINFIKNNTPRRRKNVIETFFLLLGVLFFIKINQK